MINKLYISTVEHDWNGNNSVLLNRHNIDKIISSVDNINCHTSVEDLFCENISVACNNANEIILVGLDENIDISNDNCFSYGRLFNELIRHPNKINLFRWKKDFNFLEKTRNNNNPVLWTAGCSVTYGTGVDYSNRWGSLLADYLKLPEVTVSRAGSSILMAADQLLRSDIQQGDIVVWGLTNVPRVAVSKNWNFDPAPIKIYSTLEKENQYWTLDYFESETQVLSTLRAILQVVNFCQKIKAKLYLANILDIAWLGVVFNDFDNFIDLTQRLKINGNTINFIDLGTDNMHPGPKQHQQYAEALYNFIKEN
jgi:lysophospholipase L1-like esterase